MERQDLVEQIEKLKGKRKERWKQTPEAIELKELRIETIDRLNQEYLLIEKLDQEEMRNWEQQLSAEAKKTPIVSKIRKKDSPRLQRTSPNGEVNNEPTGQALSLLE